MIGHQFCSTSTPTNLSSFASIPAMHVSKIDNQFHTHKNKTVNHTEWHLIVGALLWFDCLFFGRLLWFEWPSYVARIIGHVSSPASFRQIRPFKTKHLSRSTWKEGPIMVPPNWEVCWTASSFEPYKRSVFSIIISHQWFRLTQEIKAEVRIRKMACGGPARQIFRWSMQIAVYYRFARVFWGVNNFHRSIWATVSSSLLSFTATTKQTTWWRYPPPHTHLPLPSSNDENSLLPRYTK